MTAVPDLPTSRTPDGAAGLAALLADPARALVALDYDGTLSPIVARPQDAVPAPGAVDALALVAARVGSVAIITGRPVADVLALGGFADRSDLGGLVILGQYGLQRWERGRVTSPDPLPGVAVVRAALPALLEGAPAGLTVEDKGHALVVHVRQAADPDGALARFEPALRRLAEDNGLVPEPGRRVLELRPPGHDKRAALLTYAAERSAHAVLFGGDDVGDLPAFDAVDELRAAGVPGVTVCSDSPEVTAVRERADVVVDGPAGVAALLRTLATVIDA